MAGEQEPSSALDFEDVAESPLSLRLLDLAQNLMDTLANRLGFDTEYYTIKTGPWDRLPELALHHGAFIVVS